MIRRTAKKLLCALGVGILLASATAEAATLNLDYTVTPDGGGLFAYEFTLSIDESASPFVPGEGWSWIIFGDIAGNPDPVPSPLTDWVGGSIVGGPWTSFNTSGGGHNGPTLDFVLDLWLPADASETVFWSGTSTAFLGHGELLFSSLITDGGATEANFKVANLVGNVVPEPSTLALIVVPVVAALIRARRRQRPLA